MPPASASRPAKIWGWSSHQWHSRVDRAKNSSLGGAGAVGGTKIAQVVSAIQDELPLARVLYCSATGVSEVAHMAYLSRLGLWGPRSSFPDARAFIEGMRTRGLGFLEMLAMELKGNGSYVARSLSFHNAEFIEVGCPLSEGAEGVYNGSVRFWNLLKAELGRAAEALGGEAGEVPKAFWALQQRFFRLNFTEIRKSKGGEPPRGARGHAWRTAWFAITCIV